MSLSKEDKKMIRNVAIRSLNIIAQLIAISVITDKDESKKLQKLATEESEKLENELNAWIE